MLTSKLKHHRILSVICLLLALTALGYSYRQHRDTTVKLTAAGVVLTDTTDQLLRTDFLLQALDIDPEAPWYQTPGIRITTYQAVKEQCDSRPWETANGKIVNYHTVAISPDLRDRLGWQLGNRLFIPGFGLYYINDLTNARLRKTVDILVPLSAVGRYSRESATVMWIPKRRA